MNFEIRDIAWQLLCLFMLPTFMSIYVANFYVHLCCQATSRICKQCTHIKYEGMPKQCTHIKYEGMPKQCTYIKYEGMKKAKASDDKSHRR